MATFIDQIERVPSFSADTKHSPITEHRPNLTAPFTLTSTTRDELEIAAYEARNRVSPRDTYYHSRAALPAHSPMLHKVRNSVHRSRITTFRHKSQASFVFASRDSLILLDRSDVSYCCCRWHTQVNTALDVHQA